MRKTIIVFSIIGFLVACSHTIVKQLNSESLIRDAWLSLPDSRNGCSDVYDYFPNGGIRSFYCHLKQAFSYGQLEKLAGVPVFVSGPHSKDELDLNAKTEFGHYNPEFVKWLNDHAIPAMDNSVFRRATQGIYDGYVKNLARTYFVTYLQLREVPEYFTLQKIKYKGLMDSGSVPFSYGSMEYFGFADLADAGYNGNVVGPAVLFWIRRSMDGTDVDFFQGLKRLLKTYDGEFLARSFVFFAG